MLFTQQQKSPDLKIGAFRILKIIPTSGIVQLQLSQPMQ